MEVQSNSPYEDALQYCIADICRSIGFNYVNSKCLFILKQHLTQFILQVGLKANCYCELSRRTDPTFVDVMKSLSAFKLDLPSLLPLVQQPSKSTCISFQPCSPTKIPQSLSVGKKQPHPNCIPENLPPFPDPHTYLATPSNQKADLPYSQQRESMAIQKRHATESLIQYALRVHKKMNSLGEVTHSKIFNDELSLIPPSPSDIPYLSALVPITLSNSASKSVKRKENKLSEIDISISNNPFLMPPKRKRMKLRLCLDLN